MLERLLNQFGRPKQSPEELSSKIKELTDDSNGILNDIDSGLSNLTNKELGDLATEPEIADVMEAVGKIANNQI